MSNDKVKTPILEGPKDLTSDGCVCSAGDTVASLRQETAFDFKELLCPKCGLLRPYSPDINYFALLGVSPVYNLDLSGLHKNYIKRQLFFHPDRWLSKSNRAQSSAATYSSSFNEAYKALSCPFLRASYLLSLRMQSMGEEGKKKPIGEEPDLLSFFALREHLEAATSPEARSLAEKSLAEQRETLEKNLLKAFECEDLGGVASLVDQERFLTRALETLRK